MASAVAAQGAIPETPPELRDFRLDPVRPQPTPVTQPEVQPPPVVRTVEPPRPVERRPERVAPQPRQAERPVTTETDAPTPETAPLTEDTPAPEPAIVEPLPETAAPLAKAQPIPTTSPSLPWWLGLAGIAAALALLGGWLYWRRRPVGAVDSEVSPSAERFEPAPAPVIVPQPARIKVVENTAPRPRILLEFIPDKATLGFNALTLKGQLRLVNEGDSPATDLQFRAILTSANQRQNETIAAFESGAITIAPNAIGSAKEGERLALDIEMSVPVNELESYTVGEKRIFVPLMLASLEYAWANGKDSVTIACMIGRETEPPQLKMGPLRLDLGPRSFAPLGQRPVYA